MDDLGPDALVREDLQEEGVFHPPVDEMDLFTLENERNPREDRRLAAAIWLGTASVENPFREAIAARARQLEPLGFGPLDALHTAYAEEAGARWLVTTDDRLQALGSRHRKALRVEILGPVQALEASQGGDP